MKVEDRLCKLAVRNPILISPCDAADGGPALSPLHWHSAIAVWRHVWQCETSVGLA